MSVIKVSNPVDALGYVINAIDELGYIKAEIAKLEMVEKQLRERVIAMGGGEGELFRATVSTTERETLNMEAVRAKLSPQFIRRHTRVTPVTVVKVVARNARVA